MNIFKKFFNPTKTLSPEQKLRSFVYTLCERKAKHKYEFEQYQIFFGSKKNSIDTCISEFELSSRDIEEIIILTKNYYSFLFVQNQKQKYQKQKYQKQNDLNLIEIFDIFIKFYADVINAEYYKLASY